MHTSLKLAGFGVGLLAVFGAASGIGAAIGPVDGTEQPQAHDPKHGSTTEGHGGMSDMPGMDDATQKAELPGGLMVSQNGYTLDALEPVRAATKSAEVRFRILGPDGSPVRDYTQTHGKDLHLIAVRRDLAGYQHVHPRLDDTGTWTATLDLSRPGEYRLFADFQAAAADEATTLGTDLSVSGAYTPQQLPPAQRTATVGDYTVTLDGRLVAGEDSKLTLTVMKDGRPVDDLEPYLEAYGHLVALRDGDLAYLHVHPAGSPGDGTTEPGPQITFYASVPSTGDYRLFLDFKHQGQVRTAEFTAGTGTSADAEKTGDSKQTDEHAHEDSGGHGH